MGAFLSVLLSNPIVVVALYVAAALSAVLVVTELVASVKGNSRLDSYPFQSTLRMLRNEHRLLDFFQDELDSYKKKDGKETIRARYLLSEQFVLTSNIDNITHVLKDVENYGKGPSFQRRFTALLGSGIFNTDGDIWYKHRKTSSHLFNLGKFKSGVQETFNNNCDKLSKILNKSGGSAIDIQSLMFKFTLDSIGYIAFGSDIGALDKERVQFADDFDFCQESINRSFFDPLWLVKRYLTPDGWNYFAALRRINAFASDLVKKKREAMGKLTKEEREDNSLTARNGRDLLSLYLSREESEDALTDEFLRDIVLNFVIAGRDTTAQALSWSFYMLCCHLHEQKIVQEEIDTVLKKYPNVDNDHISYDALGEMKYLDAFCYEVLRLYPSVPKEAKYAYKADVLPDGTKLEGGELVLFCPYVMGRDPNLWEDPLKFDPNRFYNKPKPSPFIFTAFQAGPRMCLGMNMAILEMKCVLARVLSRYDVTLMQPKESVTYRNSITLPILNSLMVSVKYRK